jgi:hypothetical protein
MGGPNARGIAPLTLSRAQHPVGKLGRAVGFPWPYGPEGVPSACHRAGGRHCLYRLESGPETDYSVLVGTLPRDLHLAPGRRQAIREFSFPIVLVHVPIACSRCSHRSHSRGGSDRSPVGGQIAVLMNRIDPQWSGAPRVHREQSTATRAAAPPCCHGSLCSLRVSGQPFATEKGQVSSALLFPATMQNQRRTGTVPPRCEIR